MAFKIGDLILKFVRPAAAEFVGTGFFVFLVACTVTTKTTFIPLVVGLAITVAVIVFMDISGAHVNPVVTLAVYLSGGIKLSSSVFYIVSQLLGSIVGAAFAKVVIPKTMWEREQGGSNFLGNDSSPGQAIFIEIIITANLVTVILVTALDSKTKSSLASVAIGMAVACGNFASSEVTGGSMNPARSFGPAVVSSTWDHHYIFWVGPIVGSLVACLVYNLLLASPEHLFWLKRSEKMHRKGKKYTEAETPMAEEET